MEYLCWESIPVGNSCILDSPENVELSPRLTRGVPFAADFPQNAFMRMSRDAKKRTALVDDLMNTNRIKVCSPRLVAFLKERNLRNLEYLRIKILDHKGKVAASDYSIVHPIQLQDALDVAASKPTWSPIAKTEIQFVQTLVVDPSKVDPAVRVFRLKSFLGPVLIEKSLADEIAAAGFKGCYFGLPSEWGK